MGINPRDTGINCKCIYPPADGMTVHVKDRSKVNACNAGDTGTAIVMWGDGSTTVKEISVGDIVANHTYSQPGVYTIGYSFKDSKGNKSMAPPVTVTVPDDSTSVCNVEGDITGTTPLINTMVKLKQGYSIVKMGRTDATGHYYLPNVQAGKKYTIEPSRNGYSFTPETDTFTLNCYANATGHDFTATSVW